MMRSWLKSRSLCCALAGFSCHGFAIEPYIQQLTALSFGELVPRTGYCELDSATGNLTSSNQLCLGSSSLGQYQLIGPANQTYRITFHLLVDAGQGIQFAPKAKLSNNLGQQATALISGTDLWFDTGSDGVIDISVGGTLTVSAPLASGTPFVWQYDIEYIEP